MNLASRCRDKERIERIVLSLQLRIAARDTRHADPRVHLQAICAQWLPLADAVLGTGRTERLRRTETN